MATVKASDRQQTDAIVSIRIVAFKHNNSRLVKYYGFYVSNFYSPSSNHPSDLSLTHGKDRSLDKLWSVSSCAPKSKKKLSRL